MIPEQLRQQLSEEYAIVDFIDLGDLSASAGYAYKKFKSLRKDEFADNERIVVYTEHLIPDDLLAHLYSTAMFVDIGTWFILICSPHSTASEFQHIQVDITGTKELQNKYILPDTICAIPWNNVEVRNNGDMSPCCFSENLVLGNIKDTTLKDAFNSEAMQKLRNDLASGVRNAACNNCWRREKQGLSSIRQHNIKRLREDFLLEKFESPSIGSLDIKFSNTCNFKCMICGPGSSSMRADEDHKFKNVPLVSYDKWFDSDTFINQLTGLLPTLSNIDMYGGEPFLIKKYRTLLQTAIDLGYAKNIRLHYNSNGSTWPVHVVDLWPHFKEVDIHFSIDAVGKQFEYQRGGTWEDVEANILKIKNLNYPNLHISVMPSISAMNVYYIDRVLDWASKHNFQIFASHVKRPPGLSLLSMTAEAKALVANKYKDHPWQEIKNILETMNSAPGTNGEEFAKTVRYYDEIRKTNFADYHKEIALAMNYVYTT